MADRNERRNENARPGEAGNLGRQIATTPDELDNESDVERVEILASGAEDSDDVEDDDLSEKLSELAASTEEEVDALQVNLAQDDDLPSSRDGSGRIVDDVAEESLARFTEASPLQEDIGAVSVEPGRDDTSGVLRQQNPGSSIAGSDTVLEGNLDEPMDETIEDRKAD
ncbi:MAG: hypothetical protein JST28_15920 [Acidobacteria bacterium]|nr:hypothetical protein [Acidobacteriota bacterium]